jgi:hypothetical protein
MVLITTWADGLGVWHASVPLDTDSERRAREAILDELRIRSHDSRMTFAYKHMTVTRERITNHGTVVYVETWPENYPELQES